MSFTISTAEDRAEIGAVAVLELALSLAVGPLVLNTLAINAVKQNGVTVAVVDKVGGAALEAEVLGRNTIKEVGASSGPEEL